jgi:hypothetical protein
MCSGDVLHTLRGKYIINKLGEQKHKSSRVGFKNEDDLNIWSLSIPFVLSQVI